jgi:hypothetical protein
MRERNAVPIHATMWQRRKSGLVTIFRVGGGEPSWTPYSCGCPECEADLAARQKMERGESPELVEFDEAWGFTVSKARYKIWQEEENYDTSYLFALAVKQTMNHFISELKERTIK